MRTGYKKTELGLIPEDWDVVEFGDIVELGKNKANPKKNGMYQCVELEHIEQKTGRLLGYSLADKKTSTKTFFKHGDILFGKLRPYLMKYCCPEFDGVCSTEIFVFSPKAKIDNKFVFNIVQTDGFIGNAVSKSFGTKMPRTNWKIVKEYLIPLPPLPEQQKIAEILTTVDDKISSIEDRIQQTEQLKKGLMEKLLTEGIGHTRFKNTKIGRIPEEWEVKKFQEVMVLQRGFDLPVQNRSIGEYPILASNGIIDYHNEFRVKEPGIITGRSGTLGKVHFIEKDYWPLNTTLYVKEIYYNNPKFLYYFLQHLKIERYGTGTGVPTLNRNVVHKIRVILPPLPEQKQIATILSTVDDKLNVLQTKKTSFETLKKGLMEQLLTGERRVKL